VTADSGSSYSIVTVIFTASDSIHLQSLHHPTQPLISATSENLRKAGKMLKSSFLVFSVLFASCTVYSAVDVEIENKNVDRTIDLSSQLVKVSLKITLEHKSKKPISNYVFLLPSNECDKLSFISARDSAKKELKTTLTRGASDCSYSMTLPAGQNSGNPVVYIETIFSKFLEPFPVEITQAERQLVRYFGNAVFYSPFKTLSQKTTVHLASRNVESFTQVKPSAQSDTQIVYGPYENIARKKLVDFS
jgi:oligosaccharyltransferase complex subunit alpha (ribophorin I)